MLQICFRNKKSQEKSARTLIFLLCRCYEKWRFYWAKLRFFDFYVILKLQKNLQKRFLKSSYYILIFIL